MQPNVALEMFEGEPVGLDVLFDRRAVSRVLGSAGMLFDLRQQFVGIDIGQDAIFVADHRRRFDGLFQRVPESARASPRGHTTS